MHSNSYRKWSTVRKAALDELEAAHRSVGGSGRGRRYATQQINQAYTVLLSSQFQGFCRDLHSECVDLFVQNVTSAIHKTVLRKLLTDGRKLDKGNPNPGNIGADFNRFGLLFWSDVNTIDQRNQVRQNRLEELNEWRNAIAHQDFDLGKLGTTPLQLRRIRDWRNACHQLAKCFDQVFQNHLKSINGITPW